MGDRISGSRRSNLLHPGQICPLLLRLRLSLARAICAALSDALRLTKERQTACKKTTDRTGSSAMWLLSWRRWSICTAALP